MARLIIDKETCSACESCIPACPFGALSMKEGVAAVDEKCTFCGACVEVCPVGAITLEKEEKAVTICSFRECAGPFPRERGLTGKVLVEERRFSAASDPVVMGLQPLG